MKRNLTDPYLQSVTSGGKRQVDIRDQSYPGLCIRVSAEKRKTWRFVFWLAGTGERGFMSFGTYPSTTLEQARLRAVELRRIVEAGKDPRVVEAKPSEKTIKMLVNDRLADARRRGLRSVDGVERLLTQNVLPVVGDLSVRDFHRRHLNRIIEPMIARGAEVSANRTIQQVKALFNFALEAGEVDFNPVARAKMATRETPRDRWLTATEIRNVWCDADTVLARTEFGGPPSSPHVPMVLRLCLATGQRLSEVCGMVRSEIDLDQRLWTIPAARVKNGTVHVVPLNDLAILLIGERLRKTNAEILFPRNSDADKPIEHRLVDRAVKRAHDEKAEDAKFGRWGMPAWTPHDLRRTVATQMSMEENGLEIDELHISHVLNHRTETNKGITKSVYNKNTYLREKKTALDKWGRFLANLVGVELEEREAA